MVNYQIILKQSFYNLLEEIYLSCILQKYNRFGFRQERTLLITNKNIFNKLAKSKKYDI